MLLVDWNSPLFHLHRPHESAIWSHLSLTVHASSSHPHLLLLREALLQKVQTKAPERFQV